MACRLGARTYGGSMPQALDTKSPRSTDVHVGHRIKMRRMMLGITQSTLAEGPGLTFQQVQKYENGGNRVGASRLWQLSQVLQVPVSFFFEGSSTNTAASDFETSPLR